MYTRPVLKEILIATAEITASSGIEQLSKRLDYRVSKLAKQIWSVKYRSDDQLLDRMIEITSKKRLSEQKGLLFQELGNLMLAAYNKETANQTYRDCHNYTTKWHAIFEMMVERRYFHVAEYIGNKLINKAKIIGAYPVISTVLRFNLHQATLYNNKRAIKVLDEQYAAAKIKVSVTEEGRRLYLELITWFHNGACVDNEFARLVRTHRRLSNYSADNESPIFHFHLTISNHLITRYGYNDHGRTALKNGLTHLHALPYTYQFGIGSIYLWLSRMALVERDYEMAAANLEIAGKSVREGEASWFEYQEMNIIHMIHKSAYRSAVKKFHEVMLHEDYDIIPALIRERLKLIGCYLHLLKALGKLNNVDMPGTFRIHKFLNEIPLLSKYRYSWNIPVIIAQLSHYIASDNKKLMERRVDATDKYLNRYMKGKATRRSRLFIKLLLELPKKGWNKRLVVRSAKVKFDQMNDMRNQDVRFRIEWEIVPYEVLWQAVETYVFSQEEALKAIEANQNIEGQRNNAVHES
jgi:hypothetical protein